jgi:hypothetical protein
MQKASSDKMLPSVRWTPGERASHLIAAVTIGTGTHRRVVGSTTTIAISIPTEPPCCLDSAPILGGAACSAEAIGQARIHEIFNRRFGQARAPQENQAHAPWRPLAHRAATAKSSPRSSSAITKNTACPGHAHTRGVRDDAAQVDTLN